MVLISTKINEIIFFLLKNIEMVKQKNKIFKEYQIYDKTIKISTIEKIFYKKEKTIEKLLIQLVFWSEFLPFTLDFILFVGIYFIFEDRFNHVKNLLIIGNPREVFHYIRQLWYRNTIGYYNEEDFLDIDIETMIKKINGIIIEEDSFKDINKNYKSITFLYENNKKVFNNYEKQSKTIEEIQSKNELFNKSLK